MPRLQRPNTTKIFIVRSKYAGVNVGEIVKRYGTEVTLSGSHKVWRWRGANTLHELAAKGSSMTDYTRISERAPGEVTLTEVIEVIECSAEGGENLRKPRWL